MAYRKIEKQGYTLYENENGPTLGTALNRVIEQDGMVFRDLCGTGELLPFEDWRLSYDERARDLAARLPVEAIAGLMLYSPHQTVPAAANGPFPGHYDGKSFDESGLPPESLTDEQKEFLGKDFVRHVLMMTVQSTRVAAKWNNAMQAYAEAQPFGVPVNFSSDPRHGAGKAGAEFKSAGVDVSLWPEGLGMAAAFSPDQCREYAHIISKEYRALGITTALSPQVDLGTEPRWMRLEDTFGSGPSLVQAYAKAYCDGLQTTPGTKDGWGKESVCAMAKHWPGGGTGESGRDAHYAFGKYAVYPGGNFAEHLTPFTKGAFALDGPTKKAASVMPYYTVSTGQGTDTKGNSYNRYLIHDLLRGTYGYDGVVCTDWGITGDPAPVMDSFGSRCYGVESLSEAERHLLAIENGVDQFGGNRDSAPVLEAYRLGCEKYGEAAMRARMEDSAQRLLINFFRVGLFENPYLDPEESARVVGCEEHRAAGYRAQLRSLVLLKNKGGAFPQKKGQKVYIPHRHIDARKNFFRGMDPAREEDPMQPDVLAPYYHRVDTPQEADFCLVFMESPLCDPYDPTDVEQGGNGYRPISLQYRPYTATTAREKSLAGGDIREASDDRGYRGKTATCANEHDLDILEETRRLAGDKPVIVCLRMHNPTVMTEVEPLCDAILIDFGVERRAVLDLLSGAAKPSGRLPVQMPRDMETVERHCEDMPLDMEPYEDEMGNRYDYGFGLTDF